MEENFSSFIANYTKDIDGKKSIDIVKAFIELYARFKTAQMQVMEIQEALGGAGKFIEELDKRVGSLEGKKSIITLDQIK